MKVPERMRMLRIEEPGRAVWAEAPVPTPGQGEVLLRVIGVATCPHWDIHILGGQPMFPGSTLAYPYLPGQPGHEALCEVAAVGPGVLHLEPGMRVAAWRDTGKPRQGFYAQFNTFAEADLLRVPDSLGPAQIASLELAMCVEVSFQQLARLGGVARRKVGLSGLGPAGLVAVQMARAHGAAEVVGIDPVESRRELALALGATRAVAPDPSAWPASRRDGALDDAIDLTGVPAYVGLIDMLPWAFDDGAGQYTALRVNQWSVVGVPANFEAVQSDLAPDGTPVTVDSGAHGQQCGWLAVRDANNRGLFAGWEFDGRAEAAVQQQASQGILQFSSTVNGLNHPVASMDSFETPHGFLGLFHGDFDEAGYRTQSFVEGVLARPMPDANAFPYVAWTPGRTARPSTRTPS